MCVKPNIFRKAQIMTSKMNNDFYQIIVQPNSLEVVFNMHKTTLNV